MPPNGIIRLEKLEKILNLIKPKYGEFGLYSTLNNFDNKIFSHPCLNLNSISLTWWAETII